MAIIYVTVGRDKHLARLIVVRRLDVEKGQVFIFKLLSIWVSDLLCVIPFKKYNIYLRGKVKKKLLY